MNKNYYAGVTYYNRQIFCEMILFNYVGVWCMYKALANRKYIVSWKDFSYFIAFHFSAIIFNLTVKMNSSCERTEL